MRKPSRFMPHYVPEQTGIFGWSLLLVLLLPPFIMLGYAFHAFPWITGTVVLVGVIATVIANRNFKARLVALATVRRSDSICSFSRSFDTREVDTWVIRAVYEQLQNYLSSAYPDFPIRADDRLIDGLSIDAEDLDMDLVSEIAERTGRSLENAKSNPYYQQVHTVRDLVLFFNAQPLTSAQLAKDK